MSVYDSLDESKQFACRVIADHARAAAFAIADGILPGNEGRNYVLRKIMRRAIYHGREHLGLEDLFFYKVCDLVVENFGGAYPELTTQRDFIGKMVRLEEERFANTVTVGLARLNDLDITADTPKDSDPRLSRGEGDRV
jgi:alanyl-tRNA synthetase